MDMRTAQATADEINAKLADWEIAIGGGSNQYAAEVRAATSRMLNRVTGETVESVGIQARVSRAWYWLTDGQVSGMLERARSI